MIHFRLFGTLELRNGKEIDLHTVLAHSKHTALLAYLATGAQRRHRREQLTAVFWPDLDDVRARNALSKALHRLRRALGDDFFVVQGNETVGINTDEFWCDVGAFDAAASDGRHSEALELYRRGEFLEGFTLTDAGEFERWLESERIRLRRRALQSTVALADDAERAGDLVGATEWTRVACELSPYDEIALRSRLRALGRSGDRAGVLNTYQAFAELIAKEFEAEPAPETRTLVQALCANPQQVDKPSAMVADGIDIQKSPVLRISDDQEGRRVSPSVEAVLQARSTRRFGTRSWIAAVALGVVISIGTIIQLAQSSEVKPVVAPRTNAYVILDHLREGLGGAVAALADTLYEPWSTAHERQPNFAAFLEFMRGLDAVVHQGPQAAVDHLQKAVTLDTGFVEAKIWLLEEADVLGKRALVDSIRLAALAQRGRLGAFDQMSLDRELAFLAGRWEDAYAASRRLVAIAPATPDAQVYLAQAAMATRRYPEAVAVLHRMDRTKSWLRDLSQLTMWDLQAHRLMGDDAGAAAEWRDAFKRAPDDYGVCAAGVIVFASLGSEDQVNTLISQCADLKGAPQFMDRAYEVAGRGYQSRGHAVAGRRAFERALAFRTAAAKTDPRYRSGIGLLQCELGDWRSAHKTLLASSDTSSLEDRAALAVAAAHVGDTATVNATLRWMDEWRRREVPRGQDKSARAFIALAQGERAEAIRLLRQAIDEGAAPAWASWYVRFELQSLHGDPRFEELVRSRT